MLTIFVSPYSVPIITSDGFKMKAKLTTARLGNTIAELREFHSSSTIREIQVVLFWRFLRKRLHLPQNVHRAILHYMRQYQGKQDYSYDCYAFANTVHELPVHTVTDWKQHWTEHPLPRVKPTGSVVFLISENGDYFHHAAVYIGFGLYLSVYGAGGDLEVATLKQMIDGYDAGRVMMMLPK